MSFFTFTHSESLRKIQQPYIFSALIRFTFRKKSQRYIEDKECYVYVLMCVLYLKLDSLWLFFAIRKLKACFLPIHSSLLSTTTTTTKNIQSVETLKDGLMMMMMTMMAKMERKIGRRTEYIRVASQISGRCCRCRRRAL